MAGEPISSVDRQSFRDAMSRLGSAVHVVTSDGVAGRLGLTASAVCSVSDSPATLLMCINRSSQQNEPLKRNGVFCVNSLAGHQRQFSDMFAGFGGIEMHDRFAQGSWRQLLTGLRLCLMELSSHSTAEFRLFYRSLPIPWSLAKSWPYIRDRWKHPL